MTRDEALKDFNRKRLAAMDRVRRDKRLSSSIRAVGAELFSKAYFNTGFADVDQDWLAEKLGLSARTVKTAIKVLQETGYFEVVRPGRRSSNRYRPNFDAGEVQNLPLPDDREVQNLHLPEPPEVQKTTAGGAKNDRREVQNLHHSTSLRISLTTSLPAAGAAAGEDGAGGRPSAFEERAGAALRARVGEATYASWLGKLDLVSEEGGTLTLAAPTPHAASYVRNNFETAIIECCGIAGIERLALVVRPPAAPSLGDRRARDNGPAPNPDAQWLATAGTDLVAELIGKRREKAAAEIRDWLAACSRDPASLRSIITAAAEQNLQGDGFRRVVRQRAQSFRQGQLKFGVEERLKRRHSS